jgi:hypothetical protein
LLWLLHQAQSSLAAQLPQLLYTSQLGTWGHALAEVSQLGQGLPSLGPSAPPSRHVRVLRQ